MSLRTGIAYRLTWLDYLGCIDLTSSAVGNRTIPLEESSLPQHGVAKGVVSNERAGHCVESELLLTVATVEAGLLAIDPRLR